MSHPLVGYITMTGDTPHEGHFLVLKAAKSYVQTLWVGITTDETAQRQKRPTIMPWSARAAVFRHCQYVDAVVAHHGEPKSEAWNRLRFDVCFTCEEYFDGPEFEELRTNTPKGAVRIVCVPRTPDVSSSEINDRVHAQCLNQWKVLECGIAGNLLQFEKDVIKPIHFSQWEDVHATKDVFGFFGVPRLDESTHQPCVSKLPRQFKHLNEKDLFPNISGIHSGREVYINRVLEHAPFCLFKSFQVVHDKMHTGLLSHSMPDLRTLQKFAQYVSDQRRYPPRIVWLVMRYGGPTMLDWIKTQQPSAEAFSHVCREVASMVHYLEEHGILHGDIHPRNVLVQESQKGQERKVYLIDWGWCSARFFDLAPAERQWLEEQLETGWDWNHFKGSLRYEPACLPYLETPEGQWLQESHSVSTLVAGGAEPSVRAKRLCTPAPLPLMVPA